ncbi:acetyl-CoA C-acyltransferase [Caldiplasma sukawensis]
MTDVYIVGGARTPMGKFGKSLKNTSAARLGGIAIEGAIKKSGIEKEDVEEVIFGNVIQAGNGQNIAGQCSTIAGLSETVVKNTVNVVCASGMLAIENASREILLGERDIIVAGGTESMSNAPFLLSSGFRWGVKQISGISQEITDSLFNDGLIDAFYHNSMGYYADKTALKYNITRRQLDEFAIQSYERAQKAWDNGHFQKEVIKMEELERDEGIRKTDMETLSKLNPSFNKNGLHTAGNSSQISDGSSALVLASEKAVKEKNLRPIGKITGYWSSSLDPRDFIEAPVISTRELLDKKGWKIRDFDLVEHNEAFAAASIIVRDQLGIDNENFNPFGGAIAIGHPLGNSGSRIVLTLLTALREKKMKKGIATLCHGGGGGHTLSLEVFE